MKPLVVWDATAGLLAVTVALGIGELVTGGLGGTSPVVAVGDFVIDHAPRAATKAAIKYFGTNDKAALVVAIIAIVLAIGAIAGMIARRRFAPGAAVIFGLGLLGALAGIEAPMSSASKSALTAACASGAGIVALYLLIMPARTGAGTIPAGSRPVGPDAGRRRFFRLAAGGLGLSGASLFLGRWVFGPAVDVEAERAAVRLPTPTAPGLTPSDIAGGAIELEGISPLITPNADFYRIDTAITVPRVDVESWRLRVTGLVDNPFELTYAELLDLGAREEIVTLCCVSNEIGGDLIGNARWLGVPLATLLDRARVHPDGTQVVARSVDGFTTAFPTAVALDGRPAMVAIGMNGEVLPASHGFPARMIVPGLYGYVSATKWLEEIELTTLEGFGAYWVTRGWAKEGPIKTQSRIDVPRVRDTIAAGEVEIGGMAWGGIRSVSRVEVRIVEVGPAREAFGPRWIWLMEPDYGEWRQARLSEVLSPSSWRQWALDWDATPGEYRIEVRATDGLGDTQTHLWQPPEPDGATGYHGFNLAVHEG